MKNEDAQDRHFGLGKRRDIQARHFKKAGRHMRKQMSDRGMCFPVILGVMLRRRMIVAVPRMLVMSLADRRVRQLVMARNHPQAERRRKEGGQHDQQHEA